MLVRAIASILNQDRDDVVIKVYDNASGDETESIMTDVAKQYPQVYYHRHPINMGGVANFNYGMSRVDTPYFSILSDDDMILPDFYTRASDALKGEPEAMFFCGRTVIYNQVEGSVSFSPANWPEGLYEAGLDSVLKMIQAHYPWPGVLWRQSIVQALGDVDSYGADDNYVIRAAARHPFIVSRHAAGLIVAHPESFSGKAVLGNSKDSSPEISGAFLDHIIGRTYQLQADLLRVEALNREARITAVGQLARRLQGELAYWLRAKALPNENLDEVRTISVVLAHIGAPLPRRAMVALLYRLLGRYRIFGRLLSAVLRAAIRVRTSRRRSASRRGPLEATMEKFISRTEGKAATISRICEPIPECDGDQSGD